MNKLIALAVLFVAAFAGVLHAQTADTLAVTTQPSTTPANATFTIEVEAQDSAMGNAVDTGYTSNVTLSINTGSGTLGGTLTTAAVSGVATFNNVTLDNVGTVTLAANDGVLTPGLSTNIAVTADRLVISIPATVPNTTAGATINGVAGITIEARDGLGNTDASYTTDITASLTTGTGTLNGTLAITPTSGVSAFTDLNITVTGAKELTFTSGALTAVLSGSFDIMPDMDDQLIFTQQPSNVATGVAVTPSITVQIQDQFGNDTVGTSNVTLAINNNPGGATLGGTLTRAGVSGLATFDDITLDAAGTSYTLDATSAGLTGATSSAFDVTTTATITVTAPNGGETASIGTNETVTWTSSGVAGNVDILLSADGGGSFPITLASNTADDGTEQITVPNNPTTQARVRVVETGGGASDDSDANFTIATAAPASATLSPAPGNPGSQNASPGSSRTALIFRVTETGGGSNFDVSSVSVAITMINNVGGAAESMVSSVALRRGSQLASVTNGSAGWSSSATTITVDFTGFTPSSVAPSGTGDFSIVIAFNSGVIPSPVPSYFATINSADINSGTAITGGPVTGGTITLSNASGSIPDDPFDDDDDSDSCNLSTHGGPAWPVILLVASAILVTGLRRRKA